MKIACERCSSSCCSLIDRMMRCERQWHYGLSGRNKAVGRAQLYGNLKIRRVDLGGRGKSEGKKSKEKSIIWNRLQYGTANVARMRHGSGSKRSETAPLREFVTRVVVDRSKNKIKQNKNKIKNRKRKMITALRKWK